MSDEAPTNDTTQRRSLAMWILLFAVWIVGLIIWAGYLVMIGWLLYKFLS
jgi:hypothetical protein